MIYIASPYTHTSPRIMASRHKAVLAYAGNLKRQGILCFSPIVYGHQFYLHGYAPPEFTYWKEMNDRFLLACSSVSVLRLEGFELSKGIAHEVSFAKKHLIPVRYVLP